MVRRAYALLFALALGCQGDPVGESSAAGGSAGAGSGGTTASGGAGSGGTGVSGPGAHGSLPSGYCCTSDQDCRYRTCLDFGGVKMCSDPCTQEDTCNSAPNLTCDQGSGQCSPKAAPSCIPANQWTSGVRPVGACCVATGDGHAGEECQGNLCMAFGELSNPFICTHACDKPADCPPKYECNSFTRFCWPIATTYDCQ